MMPKFPLELVFGSGESIQDNNRRHLTEDDVAEINKMPELLRDLARHILERPKCHHHPGGLMPQTFEEWTNDLITLAKDARELLGEE